MIEVVAGIIYKNNKFLIAQRNLKTKNNTKKFAKTIAKETDV